MGEELYLGGLVSQDKNIGKLYLCYVGNKLCLTLDNYDFDNDHRITMKSDAYLPLKRLLDYVKKSDLRRNFRANRSEWISEGNGLPEAQNRLVIYELKNIIIMKFIKSKYNTNDKADTCSIYFDLNDKKNIPIIAAVNELFAMNMQRQENKANVLTRK